MELENIIERVNKAIITVVLVLFGALLTMQVLLVYEPYRWYFNLTANIEGEKIDTDYFALQPVGLDFHSDHLIISLNSPYVYSLPKATILVNGQPVSDFTKLENRINISPGDEVTIDSSSYSLPLNFKIKTSEGLRAPAEISTRPENPGTFVVSPGK